ncbi:MAG TPA: 16S rRNA (cytidine(1402)-2'-O)-methyltransferase [Sphingomicrobium sp.]|nr:16S rRNA (cytidine(1402)-2'-O)-methyltransferase [Sphingomicrobium sp.]
MQTPLDPGLYIVATPIGNLGDLSPRAADVLRSVALVLAEDTRVTGKLLKHVGSTAPARRYDDHSTDKDRAGFVARLGTDAVALVSDAGTPLVSDPGYKLVRAARDAGADVRTVPGPCAAIAGLTVAGLPTDRFLFLGFLPAKPKARADAIAEVAGVRATLVLYESGPRLGDTLKALAEQLGPREAAVAREITKLHEECVTGTLAELAERYSSETPKGEIVLVVSPPLEADEVSDADLDRMLEATLAKFSVSRAAAKVAEELKIPRKRAYARALELSRK